MQLISFIIVGDFPNGNKNSARIRALYESFKELGWSSNIRILYPTSFQENIIESQNEDLVYLCGSSNYASTRFARYLQILKGIFNSVVYVLRLKKREVVYFYNPTFYSSIYALVFSRIKLLTIVVDQTEVYSLERNKVLNKMAEYTTAKCSTFLLAISNNIAKHFNSFGTKNITHFPIMVDIKRFSVEVNAKYQILGYIGSFAPKDGIDLMLTALKESLETLPGLKLRLIGDHCEFPELNYMIDNLKLRDSVEVLGKVSYEQIPTYLKECDSLIMNRNSSKFSETGYPIKLGEYFACKRPVLMSDGPGFSEDFTHLKEAIKYTADDAQALADAIVFRYENEQLAQEIAQRGYDYALTHFDSKKQVKKLIKWIDEL